jgi:hypothetical protein
MGIGKENAVNGTPSIQVAVVRGEIPDRVVGYARDKVGAVLRLAPAPVLFARVTLAHEDAPSMQRPAIAKATLDVNGRPVRAHVAAGTDEEAVDLLEAKLRHCLEILAERRQARRHEPATVPPGAWRRGALPTDRPEWFPRPVEDRELVRRKAFLLRQQTVEEAAADLDLLDQDWVLFTELGTGADALLARTRTGLRLQVVGDETPDLGILGGTVEVRPGAPRMDLPTARTFLDETDEPFVFIADADTGRGRVVYRRYDGHYATMAGEVLPAGSADEHVRSPT